MGNFRALPLVLVGGIGKLQNKQTYQAASVFVWFLSYQPGGTQLAESILCLQAHTGPRWT